MTTVGLFVDMNYALRLAWRARFGVLCFWLVVGIVVFVWTAGQFSARQPATVALDVGISFIRLTLPLLAVLLAQELFAKEFERRYCLTSFTYPRPRHQWMLGRFMALIVVCTAVLVILACTVAGLTTFISRGYIQGTVPSLGVPYLITQGFIWVDLFTVASFATLVAIVATTPAFVLVGTVGFVVISRSYSVIIELLRQDRSLVAKFANPESYRDSLSLLSFIAPDLGGLDVRAVALYNNMQFLPEQWYLLLSATTAYGVALLAIAAWWLRHRDFG